MSESLAKTALYYANQYWIDMQDPRTRTMPLVDGGIWKILAIVGAYLALVRWLLPAFMANRKPLELRKTMLAYNVAMVLVNAYFFYELVVGIDYGRRFLDFDYPDRTDVRPRTMRELRLGWWAWMSRFADMLDTVFMALRKKEAQISFLHLYHHTSVG